MVEDSGLDYGETDVSSAVPSLSGATSLSGARKRRLRQKETQSAEQRGPQQPRPTEPRLVIPKHRPGQQQHRGRSRSPPRPQPPPRTGDALDDRALLLVSRDHPAPALRLANSLRRTREEAKEYAAQLHSVQQQLRRTQQWLHEAHASVSSFQDHSLGQHLAAASVHHRLQQSASTITESSNAYVSQLQKFVELEAAHRLSCHHNRSLKEQLDGAGLEDIFAEKHRQSQRSPPPSPAYNGKD
jgi:hypothetical protein